MKVVGVIPSRWASTRLPGKSLIPLCGKPLIQWVVEAARKAKSVDKLLVATDDERIRDAVRALGVEAVMTRPQHPSGTDRIAEAIRGTEADVVINIQGDEPLIDPLLIDRLAEAMRLGPEWDMATAAARIRNPADLNNPSVVKVVWGARKQALYFSRSLIPYVRDDPFPEGASRHWRHIGIYAYRTSFLTALVKTPPSPLELAEKLEQLRALHIGAKILVLETEEAGIGVDTEADVAYVEALLQKRADAAAG